MSSVRLLSCLIALFPLLLEAQAPAPGDFVYRGRTFFQGEHELPPPSGPVRFNDERSALVYASGSTLHLLQWRWKDNWLESATRTLTSRLTSARQYGFVPGDNFVYFLETPDRTLKLVPVAGSDAGTVVFKNAGDRVIYRPDGEILFVLDSQYPGEIFSLDPWRGIYVGRAELTTKTIVRSTPAPVTDIRVHPTEPWRLLVQSRIRNLVDDISVLRESSHSEWRGTALILKEPASRIEDVNVRWSSDGSYWIVGKRMAPSRFNRSQRIFVFDVYDTSGDKVPGNFPILSFPERKDRDERVYWIDSTDRPDQILLVSVEGELRDREQWLLTLSLDLRSFPDGARRSWTQVVVKTRDPRPAVHGGFLKDGSAVLWLEDSWLTWSPTRQRTQHGRAPGRILGIDWTRDGATLDMLFWSPVRGFGRERYRAAPAAR